MNKFSATAIFLTGVSLVLEFVAACIDSKGMEKDIKEQVKEAVDKELAQRKIKRPSK